MNRKRYNKSGIKGIPAVCVILTMLVCCGIMAGCSVDTVPVSDTQTAYQGEADSTDTASSQEEGYLSKDICVIPKKKNIATDAAITADAALLIDDTRNKALYAQNIYASEYPASVSKIATALMTFKYAKFDDTVTISYNASHVTEPGARLCGFKEGDKISVKDLLYGMMVYSGNDAAAAIAEHVGGSTEGFVEMMNSYARELGCTGTHFTNPHGLQDENHYTTPYDIYLMLKEALNYPEFTDITQMSSYTVTYKHSDGSDASTTLTATDHYLTGEATTPKDVTILGGKTGTTDKAGNCLALLSQNAYGKPFISIVMGASSKDVLYQEMTSLLQNIN